jgi:predicted PurR-regulated permease PerM
MLSKLWEMLGMTGKSGEASSPANDGEGANPESDAVGRAVHAAARDTREVRAAHMHVATVLVAAIALVAALYLARAFFIPLIIGILGSYALSPLVAWLEKIHLPRAAAAAVVVIGGMVLAGWLVTLLSGEVTTFIEKLPETARDLRRELQSSQAGPPTALQNMQEVAKELQGAASDVGAQAPAIPPHGRAASGATSTRKPIAPAVAPVPEPTWLRDYTLAQSALVASVVGQTPIVLLLTYFLLASGNLFRRKLVSVAASSLSRKKDVVRLLEEIHVQVQLYMLATLASNALLAVVTWAAFKWLGVEQPAAWGAAAGVLHFVPYLGPAAIGVASGVAGFLQFGSISQGLVVAGASLVASGLVGFAFMTWLQSRMARVNASALFIALLFFAWLWGLWGLLLGAPIVSIAKVVFDRVDSLKPIGEFMGK